MLYSRIKQYLSSTTDSRFCITVRDNCSTDGSFEKLSTIKDNRLRLYQNKSNLGSIPNFQLALQGNNDADYVMFSIDKDMIDVKYLITFLDYLEKARPKYGYIELYKETLSSSDIFTRGIDAILHQAYLSKHPTGFFWQRDIFEEEIQKDYIRQWPQNFDFWFDTLTAHFAERFDGVRVNIPVILHGIRQIEQEKDNELLKQLTSNKTLTYNSSNWFFLATKRLETSEIYFEDLLSLNISQKDKRKVAFKLLCRLMYQVSIAARRIFHNNWEAFHYGFEWHIVPWHEMIRNLIKAQHLYNKCFKDYDNLRYIKSFIALFYMTLKVTIVCLKEEIQKPNNTPYVPPTIKEE